MPLMIPKSIKVFQKLVRRLFKHHCKKQLLGLIGTPHFGDKKKHDDVLVGYDGAKKPMNIIDFLP